MFRSGRLKVKEKKYASLVSLLTQRDRPYRRIKARRRFSVGKRLTLLLLAAVATLLVLVIRYNAIQMHLQTVEEEEEEENCFLPRRNNKSVARSPLSGPV